MLLCSLLVLLPLLAEGFILDALTCSLPAASREDLNVSTAEKTWYQQYQYFVPGVSELGCFIATQSPGASDNELKISGNFSRVPLLPVSATAKLDGNRLQKDYKGVWGRTLSGPYNLVYTDEDFFIDHFCYNGKDMAQIFTSVKKPSDEMLEKLWKIVDAHDEVKRSKFVKVNC